MQDPASFFKRVSDNQEEHISDEETLRNIKKSRLENQDQIQYEKECQELFQDVMEQIQDSTDSEIIIFYMDDDYSEGARVHVLNTLINGFKDKATIVNISKETDAIPYCGEEMINEYYKCKHINSNNVTESIYVDTFALEFNCRTNKKLPIQDGILDTEMIEKYLL